MPSPESDLERAARKFRAALLSHDRAVSRTMIDAYGQSWRRIRVQLETLNSHIAQARAAGVRVSAQWLYQQNRLSSLKQQVEQEVAGFARYAGAQIGEGQAVAVDMARAHAEQLAMAGLGPPPPGVHLNWDRLPREAVSDLVGALHNGSPLASLLAELGPTASKAVSDALIMGVATGLGPREVARIIRRDVGMSLVRALRISRTEILRSYREATRRNYQANSDVVKGWIWHSALDRRSCACCWAMHGTKHGLDERLDDHVNGRCAMLPWTASWSDILGQKGEGIPDTRPQVETGASRFEKLPDADKEAILGKAAFQAYKAGAVKLEDFVGRSFSKRWGSMRSARSLSEIVGREEAGKWGRTSGRAAASAKPMSVIGTSDDGQIAFYSTQSSNIVDGIKALSPRKRTYLTPYTASDYDEGGGTSWISEDGLSGFHVKPDGELVSVFNATIERRGHALVDAAVKVGATHLDCFDGLLPKLYARHGFVEVKRLAWDDTYAPEGWDYDFQQRPDIIFMRRAIR